MHCKNNILKGKNSISGGFVFFITFKRVDKHPSAFLSPQCRNSGGPAMGQHPNSPCPEYQCLPRWAERVRSPSSLIPPPHWCGTSTRRWDQSPLERTLDCTVQESPTPPRPPNKQLKAKACALRDHAGRLTVSALGWRDPNAHFSTYFALLQLFAGWKAALHGAVTLPPAGCFSKSGAASGKAGKKKIILISKLMIIFLLGIT